MRERKSRGAQKQLLAHDKGLLLLWQKSDYMEVCKINSDVYNPGDNVST
jgi:hypothetical protein